MDDGTISLAGDVMIRTPGLVRQAAGESGFAAALGELARSDLAIGNLEIPLSCRGYRVPKTSSLRADPAVIDDVAALGFGAVTLANNHLMDFGPDAMRDTIAACDQAVIAHCGAGMDLDAALAPTWLSAGARRIALISVACTLPVESEAGPGKPGIAPLRVRFSFEIDPNLLAEQPGTMPWVHSEAVIEDRERVGRVIGACGTAGADAVVVGIHWGVPSYWLSPYQGLLCEYQRPLARALIDAGADVVCGHHAHQLHPIEVYRGKPIFYSLGNFVFESPGDYSFMEPESLIARVTLGARLGCELVPIVLDARGLPRRAVGDEATAVLEKVRRLSQPFATRVDITNDVAVVAIADGAW